MGALQRELSVAVQAVRQAAVVCRAVQSKIDREALEKKDRSPVTVADYASQALIARTLMSEFSEDPLIGEEDASALRESEGKRFLDAVCAELDADPADVTRWIDHGGASEFSSRFWTLDPVDGTKGFLRGEQYAVALALVLEGRVSVAAAACPNLAWPQGDGTGVVFSAIAGQGAFWQPAFEDREPARISASAAEDAAGYRFCESVESGHSSHSQSAEVATRLGIEADPVRMDSQAKYGVVAHGGAEIYLRLPVRKDYVEKIWDHAAGSLVVTEAGGTVTDVDGKPLDFTRGRLLSENRGVVVSNGPLHDRILQTLRELGV
jgi:3'(2'), 5'-bisphosphate nucleotidase